MWAQIARELVPRPTHTVARYVKNIRQKTERSNPMGVAIEKEADGKVLLVRTNGKLTKGDYKHFVPEIEELVTQHGRIRVLFDMHDFHGWTAGALWEDVKFDLRHFADIERLAIVGEKAWEHGMAVFCRPFTRAKVRYFHRDEAVDARRWLEADLPFAQAPVTSTQ
jgi:hypothetical protein